MTPYWQNLKDAELIIYNIYLLLRMEFRHMNQNISREQSCDLMPALHEPGILLSTISKMVIFSTYISLKLSYDFMYRNIFRYPHHLEGQASWSRVAVTTPIDQPHCFTDYAS